MSLVYRKFGGLLLQRNRLLSSVSHRKPYDNKAYAEKLTLSHELFKSKSESKKPPLVIKHGLLGSKTNWRSLAKNFNRTGHEVLTLDLRNHGHSPHSSFMNYEIMANDVIHTVKKILHGHKKFDFMGHSMGGKVAMTIALNHGDLVSRLVVVDIMPGETDKEGALEIRKIMQALQGVQLDRNKPLPDVRVSVVEQLKQSIPDVGVCQWLATNLDWTPERGIFWKCNIKVLQATLNEIFGFPTFHQQFSGPTLFIQGERSKHMATPDRDIIVKQFFPNAEFVVIKDAGHWVHSEKPFDFLRVVDQFIK